MLFLIHGPDVVSSKNFLVKLRADYKSVETLVAKEKNAVVELPYQGDLFQNKKLVILENFPLDQINLPINPTYDIVLWFDQTLTAPPKVDRVWWFKPATEVNSFKLADLIGYGQQKQALEALQTILRTKQDEQLIVGSLVRQLKLISLSLSGESNQVSKSSFVQAKISEQARSWTLAKVKTGLLHLLKTDLLLKQGRASTELLLTNLTLSLCQLAKS